MKYSERQKREIARSAKAKRAHEAQFSSSAAIFRGLGIFSACVGFFMIPMAFSMAQPGVAVAGAVIVAGSLSLFAVAEVLARLAQIARYLDRMANAGPPAVNVNVQSPTLPEAPAPDPSPPVDPVDAWEGNQQAFPRILGKEK